MAGRRYARLIGPAVVILTLVAMAAAGRCALAQGLFGQEAAEPQQCDTRAAWTAYLAGKWEERQAGYGVTPETGNLVELWVSDAGSWSLLVSYPSSGQTCLRGYGGGWTAAPLPLPGSPT